MKVYHVETQQDYDELMSELEEKGCEWLSGHEPTRFDGFEDYGKDTCVYEGSDMLSYSSLEYFKNDFSNETLIEYKAKGENMTQEEMKQDIIDWATDVSVAVESAIKDIKFQMKKSTVKADLKEAKSSAKKLIEKIDEYLESQNPEFKVGDYVTVYVNGRKITARIDELTVNNPEAHGLWYDRTLVNFKQDYWFVSGDNKARHATPIEIEEYKVALTFHKHGRKPFELKKGDLIRTPSGNSTFILNPENYTNEEFLDYGWEFLKTAEEVNEWLENK